MKDDTRSLNMSFFWICLKKEPPFFPEGVGLKLISYPETKQKCEHNSMDKAHLTLGDSKLNTPDIVFSIIVKRL